MLCVCVLAFVAASDTHSRGAVGGTFASKLDGTLERAPCRLIVMQCDLSFTEQAVALASLGSESPGEGWAELRTGEARVVSLRRRPDGRCSQRPLHSFP